MNETGFGDGCLGGYMETAFQYIIENQGIDTEQSYQVKILTKRFCN